MRKIGEGWQYAVYDIGNGRVLKKFHSWPRAFWVILKTILPFRDDSFWEIPGFIRGVRKTALVSFEILKRRNIPREWIGNPTFISRYDFEQDKVSPLHQVFEKSSTEEINKLINKFIGFNKQLLALGVIDKSFNITKNYGLSGKNQIVLIDIGELFDNPTLIERQRRNRAWAKPYVANCIKNEEARKYFLSEMDKSFGFSPF